MRQIKYIFSSREEAVEYCISQGLTETRDYGGLREGYFYAQNTLIRTVLNGKEGRLVFPYVNTSFRGNISEENYVINLRSYPNLWDMYYFRIANVMSGYSSFVIEYQNTWFDRLSFEKQFNPSETWIDVRVSDLEKFDFGGNSYFFNSPGLEGKIITFNIEKGISKSFQLKIDSPFEKVQVSWMVSSQQKWSYEGFIESLSQEQRDTFRVSLDKREFQEGLE